MSEIKVRQSLESLGRALQRLGEALAEPAENSLIVDGTIQRFEFVIELYWKTFKRLLAYEGVQVTTPREALVAAYRAGWIEDESTWLRMLRDRNETSHIYDEQTARRIYDRVRQNLPALERVYHKLIERFQGVE
ncbi:MAG: nucleotidyltransferase substrate binding protein [Candidatus Competibacteraceae bacterium]|nr:nucleotidyltransferase substrate binding protein [Candidatus Competibacteraceae bacterium]